MTLLTIEHTGLRDIPDCSRLHDVPDDELLDGLVLGHTASAVGASDGLDVTAALLGTTVVPPFLSLWYKRSIVHVKRDAFTTHF